VQAKVDLKNGMDAIPAYRKSTILLPTLFDNHVVKVVIFYM
jgi:hypothetical protein